MSNLIERPITMVNVVAILITIICAQYSCKPTNSQGDIESNNTLQKELGSENPTHDEVKAFAYPNGDVHSNLLLRKQPSRESKIVSKIPKDSAIGIIKKTQVCETIENVQSCWFQAMYHDTIGYVFGGYLWFRNLADLNSVDPPDQENKSSPTKHASNLESKPHEKYNSKNGAEYVNAGVSNQEMQQVQSHDSDILSSQQYSKEFRLTAHLGDWFYTYESPFVGDPEIGTLTIKGNRTWSMGDFTRSAYGSWRGDATKIEFWTDDNVLYQFAEGRIMENGIFEFTFFELDFPTGKAFPASNTYLKRYVE
jgi:hypothetical protein